MNDIIKALQFEKEQLEARIRLLEDKLESDNRQISEYDHELRQAKRLLKAAVEDMKRCECSILCECCVYEAEEFGTCRGHARWRYADEVEKLIGG